MSAISLKSITGITSITTPAGVDNQLTLHTNNTTEAVKLDSAGNFHFHNHLNITGISTASNFKTGSTNVHSTGVELANINTGGGTATFGGGITVAGAIDANGDLDVDGHTNLDNVSIAGVSTFTGAIDANGNLEVAGTSKLSGDVTINRTTGLLGSKLSINKDADQEGIGIQLNQNSGITTSFTTFNSAGSQIFSLAHDTDSTPDLILKLKHSSDSAPAEKLRINSNNRIGIGTATVHRILHINDTVGGGIGINGTTSGIQFGTVSMAGGSYNAILSRAGSNDDHITGSTPGDLCLAPEQQGAFILGLSPHLGAMTTGLRIDRLRNYEIYFASQIKINTGSPASPSEKLRIDSSGRVHIGHDTNIAVAGSNPRVQVTGTSDSTAHLSISNFSANTTGAILSLAKSRGSVGAYTAVQDDDVLGQINFAGADGTDLAEVAGKITVACDSTVAGNRIPSRMEFHTTDGNGNLDLNMVITRDGQLYLPQGITRDAMYNLVHHSADDFILGRTTGGADTGMTLVSPSATSGFINFADADGQRQGSILYQHGSGSDKMFFRTNNNQTGLIIDSAQRVYVGDQSANIIPSIGGKMVVSNTNMSLNSFANNQHAQTFHFTKSRATSGSGGSIVGSGDFCGHIEWYADDGVDTANQIAKISGQMDGSPGANDTPGKLLFYTTVDGANASTLRMQISSGGVVHIGSTATSNTIPTGGLDLQGNNTNCVIEMGNPLPNYNAGRVPTFKITTRDADKAVDFSSMWGGDNGLYKHITFAGGTTNFYNGTSDAEVVRITGSGLVVGTTNFSDAHNTDAGVVLNENGQVMCRRNSTMFTAKSIATGGYTAFRVLSAQTQVGSISFNSGGTSFNTSSDYRRKENVIDLTGAITRLKTLKPKRFNFISNPSVTLDGFLAHEVTTVPEAVTGTKDEVATEDIEGYTKGDPIYQQLDQSKLVPLLVAALQEAITEIETLKTKVAALEGS